jgi:hypothetical protein
MNKFQYESMGHHMKGFIQGLLFILIIIIIIAFFHFIGYLDKSFSGNDYSGNEDTDIEYWNEDIDRSDGIREGKEKKSDNPIYEQRKKDFGSKSLNEKDRDKVKKDKQEKKKEAYDYLKK